MSTCGRPDCHIWEDHGHLDTTGGGVSEPTARKLLDRTFKVTGPNSFTQDPLAAILLVARVEKVLAILKLADCRCGNIDPQKIERILNGESE